MSARKKLLYLWGPVFLWSVVIFTFSSHPTGTASQFYWNDFLLKKTAHVLEYMFLTTLLYRALSVNYSKGRALKYSVMLAIVYAATDEIHQGFTPGREPTLRDVGFDTIGALLAAYTIWNILPFLPKRPKNWLKELGIA